MLSLGTSWTSIPIRTLDPFEHKFLEYINQSALNSDIYTLPNDFNVGPKEALIYFYSNDKSSVNNKVVFTKNMVCLLQHGLKEVKTARGKEVVTNSELLLLTSGSTLMSESVAENNRYEAILIFFSNKILSDFCARRALTIDKQLQTKSTFKILKDDFLNNFCQSLLLLRKENTSEMDELKVHEILGYISVKYPDIFHRFVAQAFADQADIKLKQVVEFNANKSLTIEELAFLCNMSVSTFKRHFADLYSMSPQKYFTQLKMEQAKQWLSLQKRPSDIYPELGYENLSAFSNEFKKYYGISPKQFQNKNEQLEKQVDLPE